MEINIEPFDKQYEALSYLTDKTTTTVLYGGSLYSGKSYLSCLYAIYMSINYPGVRGAICRARLSSIIKSIYQTFTELTVKLKIEDQVTLNSHTNIISFKNGSQIFLTDLFPLPSDPNYVRFGGYELAYVNIDEAAECPLKAYQVLLTRLRHSVLKDNGLVGKCLITSNPSNGWLKDIFYTPWKNGTLPDEYKFVPALPHDNIYADPKVLAGYSIQKLGEELFNVLVLGDWDFDATGFDLFSYNDITDVFYNIGAIGQKYLTCDPAGEGQDLCVITLWNGYHCFKIHTYPKTKTTDIIQYIKQFMIIHNIKISNVIIDVGGLGMGVADQLGGCKRYISQSKVLKDEKIYNSLKDQLFFKFAQMVKDGKVGISADPQMQQQIIKELQIHKQYKAEQGKTMVTPSTIVKQQLGGKSPDIASALVYRAYFEYANTNGLLNIGGF